MSRAWAGAVALAITAIGCGGSESASADAAAAGHALKLDVTLRAENDTLAFLTPSNTIVEQAASAIVGKPYLIATFKAGFSAGNDPPLDFTWGEVPETLVVSYTTPSTYDDGPYDIVFVNYTATAITPDMQTGSPQSAPAAKGGDLASFTLSTADIHEGDPKNALGTIRLNVAGADASVSLENRTPADPDDADQTFAAFTNTVLAIP